MLDSLVCLSVPVYFRSIGTPFTAPRVRTWSTILLMAAIYAVVGKLSLLLASIHPSASPVWPPTGIALAMLLLFGPRFWPSILLGAFVVNVTTAGSILTSLLISIGNTLEAVIGSALIRRYAGGARALENVNGVLLFVLFACASTFVSATVGVGSLVLNGFAAWHDAPLAWLTWLLGDMVGALTVAPFLLLWSQSDTVTWSTRRAAEAMTLFGVIAFAGLMIFSDLFIKSSGYRPTYLAILPVMWIALRFDTRTTVTAAIMLSLIAIIPTLGGQGVFSGIPQNSALLFLQLFVAVVNLTGMLLSAALSEAKKFQQSLAQKVAERTEELAAAREQDRANLQRLKDIMNHFPVAAIAADEYLKVLHANENFSALFPTGLPGGDSHSSLLDMFMYSQDRVTDHTSFLQRLELILQGRSPVSRWEFSLQSGTHLSCDYVPILERGRHRGHVLLLRDVTEEKRIDRAKSEFMSLASHQLRTPLTKIRWSMARLAKLGPLNNGQGELLEVTRAAASSMSDTISTMLMIARIESGSIELKRTSIPLKQFLEGLWKECEEECIEKSLVIRTLCDDGLFTLTSDLPLLREILLNLLRNAVVYTPKGGDVTVSASLAGENVRIDIQDTGIGIPGEEQRSVFQKFFRAENARSVDQNGNGLGLYLAKQGTALLGATLTFTSEVGRGTTFSLSSPRSPVDALLDASRKRALNQVLSVEREMPRDWVSLQPAFSV